MTEAETDTRMLLTWSAKRSDYRKNTAIWVEDAGGVLLCSMAPRANDWIHAQKMAAAPELLAALKALVDIGNHRWRALPIESFEKRTLCEALAAIAKAEGLTQ